eukprot:gb/GFBE01020713.1/.p1 GENE.gb/GFBE01020713.1/~~gb/GFBE01020713.1/.p1  ORF type:complete len:455 (+),score=52.85 gb/GFBE01020713.1/:1-1365(+)
MAASNMIDDSLRREQQEVNEKTPLVSPGPSRTWEQCRILCLTCLGQGGLGYCISSVGTVALMMGELLSPAQQGLVASSFMAGALAAQLLFGVCADILGPRLAGLLATALAMFGACLATTAGFGPVSLEFQLVAGRFFLGLGAGAEYTICSSLAALLKSDALSRRTLLLAATISIILCGGLQYLIVFPMLALKVSEGVIWRFLLAASALPASIVFVFRLGLDESELKAPPPAPQSYGHELSSSLKGKTLQFIGLCVSWVLFSVDASGMAFGPVIYQKLLTSPESAVDAGDGDAFIIAFVSWMIQSAVALLLFKPMTDLLTLKGTTAGCLLTMAILLSLSAPLHEHDQTALSVVSYTVAWLAQSILLATFYAMAGEMFGSSTVGFYTGMAVSCQKAMATLGQYACPILLDGVGVSSTMLIWAAFASASFVVVVLSLPGRSHCEDAIGTGKDEPALS